MLHSVSAAQLDMCLVCLVCIVFLGFLTTCILHGLIIVRDDTRPAFKESIYEGAVNKL